MSLPANGSRLLALLALALVGTGFGVRRECAAEEPAPPAATEDPDDQPPEALQTRINAAIKNGVAWLTKRQGANGWWGDLKEPGAETYTGSKDGYSTPAGPTALSLYALLKCDVPLGDPAIKRGFDWLRKNQRTEGSAYEVSATLLAVTATADPFKKVRASQAAKEKVRLVGEWRTWATDLVKKLMSMRSRQGGWRYWPGNDARGGGPQDTSSTQFAVLALLAADRCELPVPAAAWTGAIDVVLAQQSESGVTHPRAVRPRPSSKDGASKKKDSPPPPRDDESGTDHARGFAYIQKGGVGERDRTPTGAMTSCGVGTLLMARYALTKRHAKVWATVDAARVQSSIYDGFAWLDLNWHPSENPGAHQFYDIYYQYCVERAMDLAGASRLGKRLWYVEMAEHLVTAQDANGMWNSKSTHADSPVLDTSFALLFLQRATRGGIPFPTVTGGSDEAPADGR
jgi:hypothetical protein